MRVVAGDHPPGAPKKHERLPHDQGRRKGTPPCGGLGAVAQPIQVYPHATSNTRVQAEHDTRSIQNRTEQQITTCRNTQMTNKNREISTQNVTQIGVRTKPSTLIVCLYAYQTQIPFLVLVSGPKRSIRVCNDMIWLCYV